MKTVLVTGTSSGFGRGIVTAFLERGYKVFATLRRAKERQDLFAVEQAQFGDRLVVLSFDVTKDADRKKAVAAVGGKLDCLVNNAGYALFGALEDTTDEQLRQQLEVNLVGAILLTRDLLPAIRESKGSIINLSSVFGYSAFPLTSVYCASKFGLEGFTEALYHEVRSLGVRVHLVEPGGHKTGFSSNVAWAAGATPAYATATRGYHAFKAKLEKKGGASPERVVKKVVDLAEKSSSALRVQVGSDARAMAFMKLLPEALALPMWSGALRKMLTPEGAS